MKTKLNNVVCASINEGDGEKIVELFKKAGVDTEDVSGYHFKNGGYEYYFYGVINNKFDNFHKNQVANATILTIEELENLISVKKTMKTFKIPEGCTSVTFEQNGEEIIAKFNKKYEPKKGDFVRLVDEDDNAELFCVFDRFDSDGCVKNSGDYICSDKRISFFTASFIKSVKIDRQLTKEEFAAEFEKLGYEFDFETLKARKKRWRADRFSNYWTFDYNLKPIEYMDNGTELDNDKHQIGFYFKTESDCKEFAEIIKTEVEKFHNR